MTTWQLTKKLLGGSGFYWRPFLAWTMMFIAIGAGYSLWQGQSQSQASTLFSNSDNNGYIDQVNLDVVVKPNGQVLANGKDVSQTLKVLPGYDEISIVAINKPNEPIGNFTAQIHLPQAVDPSQLKTIMYAVHGVDSYSSQVVDGQTLLYTAQNIAMGATVTVVADFPQNAVTLPIAKQLYFNLSQVSVKYYLIIAFCLPIITLLIMFFMVIRRRQDRFFYLSSKIINRPPNATAPAVVGALLDGHVGSREIAATLIDLACRGYLFITHHADNSFSFGKRKTLALEKLPELHEYERILLTKIFEPEQYKSTNRDVEARVGRHIFSRKIAEVYLNIYNEATNLGYFAKNPVKVHLWWRYTGVMAFFLGIAGFFYTAFYAPDPKYVLFFWVGQMAAAIVIIVLSGMMPARSVTGTANLRQWLQFRQYLNLNRDIEGGSGLVDLFTRYLPYALVLGIEADWTKRFRDQTFAKPDWYESDEPALSIEYFAGQLFPLVGYIGDILDRSHEPTVE